MEEPARQYTPDQLRQFKALEERERGATKKILHTAAPALDGFQVCAICGVTLVDSRYVQYFGPDRGAQLFPVGAKIEEVDRPGQAKYVGAISSEYLRIHAEYYEDCSALVDAVNAVGKEDATL